MKHIYILIFLGLLSLSIRAQITITSADLPVIGNMVISAVDTITAISPGNPGTNQVWDLSNLVASRYDTITYFPPEEFPGFEYSPSNILYDASKAGDCEGCSIVYSYNFAEHSDSGLLHTGYQARMLLDGGYIMNLDAHFTGGRCIIPLPLNYGDSFNGNHIYDIRQSIWFNGSMVDSTVIVENTSYSITADASGTLITPYNSFQVLRVKTTFTNVSQHYIRVSNEWVLDREETSDPHTDYTWYTNDYCQVGSCDGNVKGSGFTFFKSETVVGTSLQPFAKNMKVYPNPAKESISVECILNPDRIEVYNIQGSQVSTVLNSKTVTVSNVSPGVYILKVFTSSGVSVEKFIKQ